MMKSITHKFDNGTIFLLLRGLPHLTENERVVGSYADCDNSGQQIHEWKEAQLKNEHVHEIRNAQ